MTEHVLRVRRVADESYNLSQQLHRVTPTAPSLSRAWLGQAVRLLNSGFVGSDYNPTPFINDTRGSGYLVYSHLSQPATQWQAAISAARTCS